MPASRIPFRFAPIPDDMLFDHDMPCEVTVLWAAIYRLTDRNGVAAIGQLELGKALGWSESTVRRHLRRAEKLGVIGTVRRGKTLPNEYTPILRDQPDMTGQSDDYDRSPLSDVTGHTFSLERTNRDASLRSAPPPSKRRTAFPLDWTPDETQRAVATEAGMDATTRRAEFQKFKDHHLAHGKQMADWPAAWRTWCHNWRSFGGRPAVPDDHAARVMAGL